MKKLNKQLTALSAFALTVGVTTISAPQKADAQIVEFATSAVNAIFNRPRKPLPNQTYIFGTNNLHSNNFCLLPCTPNAPVARPVAPRPIAPSQQVVRPRTQIPPQAIPQRTNPRPTLVIPPIRLPINF